MIINLFSVKEKSELVMQIEELNEVKEQVRGNLVFVRFISFLPWSKSRSLHM